MPTRKHPTGAKDPPKANGILTTAAEAIGATLASIALKTGMATPAPVKKSSRRAAAKAKPVSKKTVSKKAVSKKAVLKLFPKKTIAR